MKGAKAMKSYLTYKKRWIYYIAFTVLYGILPALAYFNTDAALTVGFLAPVAGIGVLIAYTLQYGKFALLPILYSQLLVYLVSLPGYFATRDIIHEVPYEITYLLMALLAIAQLLAVTLSFVIAKLKKS